MSTENVDFYPSDEAETRLVNIKYLNNYYIVDVYIGNSENCPKNLNTTNLQNPYSISEHGRQSAVEMYKAYFYHRYITDKEFRRTVHNCQGKTLGGWSYPSKCHGEVIVDLIQQIQDSSNGTEILEHIQEQLENLDLKRLDIEGLKFREEALDQLDHKL